VADIYFTEFMRLFFHYYFRSVYNQTVANGTNQPQATAFLEPDDKWLKKYKAGSFRRKRVELFVKMGGVKVR
jgi:hypothetical protein